MNSSVRARASVTVVGAAMKSKRLDSRPGISPRIRALDLDRPAQALGDLVRHIDVEAFDPAAELGHRVRREGAIDAGDQALGVGRAAVSGGRETGGKKAAKKRKRIIDLSPIGIAADDTAGMLDGRSQQ